MADKGYVDGLLRERAGYETHGRADKVAEVDAELEAVGYTPPAEEPAEAEAPVEEAGGGSARAKSGRRG